MSITCAPIKGVMPTPYHASVILSLARDSPKVSLSQFCKCKDGCDQIQTLDFLVAPSAIIEYSSRLRECSHRNPVFVKI